MIHKFPFFSSSGAHTEKKPRGIPVAWLAVLLCLGVLGPSAVHADPVRSCVEAEILEVSQIPDPGKLSYPNCLVAVKVRINQIFSGPSTPEVCEVMFMLVREKKLDRRQASLVKAHHKVALTLQEFDSAPDSVRETQQVNDFMDLDSSQYYAVEVKGIADFSPVLFPQAFKGKQI